MISNWAAQLFDAVHDQPTTASPADYLCLSHLFPLLSPSEAEPIWQKIRTRPFASIPPHIGILLGGLLTELPWSDQNALPEREFAQQLVNHHQLLASQLDPTESGLLRVPTETAPIRPALQASWVWSTDQLLRLAGINWRDLPLWQELYLYESNKRLWCASSGCYASPGADLSFRASIMTDNVLALYAGLPDQERAECLLRWLQQHAPIWHSPAAPMPTWLDSTAYLLYRAMLNYDMTTEAQTVQQYAQKHLTSPPENAREGCLHLLWERVMP